MTRADVVAGIVLATVFAFLAWQATTLTYGAEFAPGPGFLPLWLGAGGAVLSLALAARARSATVTVAAARRSELRVVAAVLGIGAVIVAAPVLGFVPALALFLFAFTLGIERLPPVTALASAGGASVLIHVVFQRLLNVPFPTGPLGF